MHFNEKLGEGPSQRQQRKSLAVDQKTYDLLEEICFEERRSRIEQLKILIESEHGRIFGAQDYR
jgi:hypothetical protein